MRVPVSWTRDLIRSTKACRSASSWKILLPSIPRTIKWCRVPGTSNRACRGIEHSTLFIPPRKSFSESSDQRPFLLSLIPTSIDWIHQLLGSGFPFSQPSRRRLTVFFRSLPRGLLFYAPPTISPFFTHSQSIKRLAFSPSMGYPLPAPCSKVKVGKADR